MDDEERIEIGTDADIVEARATGRALAVRLGFSRTDATLIATAISEITRNMLVHAGRGTVELRGVYERDRHGIVVVASDDGPGIRDVELAMQDGWGAPGSLGLGLPGSRRLMDELEVETTVGAGTTVTMTKWRSRDTPERLRDQRGQQEHEKERAWR